MSRFEALLFLTEGFEEVEAVTTADILRRANISVAMVSLTGKENVTGSHGICIKSDALFESIDLYNSDMLILPGGPGHVNYKAHQGLLELIKKYYTDNKYLSAICAAPVIFGELNLLVGKKAVCFPSRESKLTGAVILNNKVVKDGKIITSKGPGTSGDFALKIVETLRDINTAEEIKKAFIL